MILSSALRRAQARQAQIAGSLQTSTRNTASRSLLGSSFAALVLGLSAACSGGSGGGGTFEITACAPLGCSTPGGVQVACGVTDIAVNQELRISFSRPVDLSSVTSTTFEVLDAAGVTPPGEFLLDANDPTVLIYRPELTFDSSGNPVFGLTQNESYEITIPGTANGDNGPFIRSQGGSENSKRLFCTVSSSLPVLDLNPGDPVADIRVDTVTSYDGAGDPLTFDENVNLVGALNVFRTSPIRFTFTDVMNPGTLVNPVTGQSDFITIVVDGDGSTGTTNDQVPIDGSFALQIDNQSLTTSLIFTPSLGYPSAGNNPTQPRRVVVTLPPTVTDLGGNQLVNSGVFTFVPESVSFPSVDLIEDFSSQNQADLTHTGSFWGADNGQGGSMLAPGIGGGSGLHGVLIVPAGESVTLSTDTEDFSGITNTAIYNPAMQIRDPLTQAPLTVLNGVYEFASLTIEAGGSLRFEGPNPARIFVRGECRILGTLDISGSSGASHLATDCAGGTGGPAGPGGGAGGLGGDRPPTAAFEVTVEDGNVVHPEAPAVSCAPTLYVDVDGKAGDGVPIPNTLAPTGAAGEGGGGLSFPQPLDGGALEFPVDNSDFLLQEYARLFGCSIKAPGSGGGGGGYGASGLMAFVGLPSGADVVQIPGSADGGLSDAIGLNDAEKSLNPLGGFLRGGSGGGGGGGHLQNTMINGFAFINCDIVGPSSNAPLRIIRYVASSSAGGGGGGGAIQLQAGRRINVQGVIDASGGSGGSDIVVTDPPASPNAMPGGGGSGGGVLLQSRTVELSSSPGRIDLRGGSGGTTRGTSLGGGGGPGLLRVETIPALLVSDLAPINCPSGPVGCPSSNFVNSPVFPDPDGLQNQFDDYPLIIDIDELVSTDEWTTPPSGTGRVSGAMSCWLQPDGNFFVLDFVEDELGGGGEIVTPAWDMQLRIAGQANAVSFRERDALFPGASIEELLEIFVGIPPVTVRFQGARTLQPFDDACSVPLVGLDSPIFEGSLTGWVQDPADLNDFFGSDPTKRPNMYRFIVVFDTRDPVAGAVFEGVEELRVTVVPD